MQCIFSSSTKQEILHLRSSSQIPLDKMQTSRVSNIKNHICQRIHGFHNFLHQLRKDGSLPVSFSLAHSAGKGLNQIQIRQLAFLKSTYSSKHFKLSDQLICVIPVRSDKHHLPVTSGAIAQESRSTLHIHVPALSLLWYTSSESGLWILKIFEYFEV